MDWKQCTHCGMGHSGQCPRIKAIDYHENGSVKRVEYHEPQQQLSQHPRLAVTTDLPKFGPAKN